MCVRVKDSTYLGADYMSRAGSVEGLALSAEMTAQPSQPASCNRPLRRAGTILVTIFLNAFNFINYWKLKI